MDSLRFRKMFPWLLSMAPRAMPSSCVKPPMTGRGMRAHVFAACSSPVPACTAAHHMHASPAAEVHSFKPFRNFSKNKRSWLVPFETMLLVQSRLA